MRRDKINYYLDIAETVSERGTCLRRNYGAIIVKNDQIISTGYVGECKRNKLAIPRGERYELCRSVHAEQNAIISASREEMIGADLFLVGKEMDGSYVPGASPCVLCRRFIINAGIKTVFVRRDRDNYIALDVADMVENDETITGAVVY